MTTGWHYFADVVSGAVVAAGSDWSVTSMNPFEAMEVAVTRRDPAAPPGGDAWLPGQRVAIEDVIRAYTLAGAMAGDMEDETGTVALGKSADLVVVDRNLLTIPAHEISDARVDLTVFQGRVVHRR